MSAKSARRPARTPSTVPAPAAAAAVAATGPALSGPESSWLESSDPAKRKWGRILLVGVWIYVGALWFLALDQVFHWGVFGPTLPPAS